MVDSTNHPLLSSGAFFFREHRSAHSSVSDSKDQLSTSSPAQLVALTHDLQYGQAPLEIRALYSTVTDDVAVLGCCLGAKLYDENMHFTT